MMDLVDLPHPSLNTIHAKRNNNTRGFNESHQAHSVAAIRVGAGDATTPSFLGDSLVLLYPLSAFSARFDP